MHSYENKTFRFSDYYLDTKKIQSIFIFFFWIKFETSFFLLYRNPSNFNNIVKESYTIFLQFAFIFLYITFTKTFLISVHIPPFMIYRGIAFILRQCMHPVQLRSIMELNDLSVNSRHVSRNRRWIFTKFNVEDL